MRKRLMKRLAAFGFAVCITFSQQFNAYAALKYEQKNSVCYVTNNPYYNEVSAMAKTISESLPEAERQCIYDTCMVSVFGGSYRNSPSKYLGDLVCVMTKDEIASMHYSMMADLVELGLVKWSDEEQELRTLTPIKLNENGINETNYEDLKVLYATFLEARERLASLDEATKIRVLHDMLVDKLDTPHSDAERTERIHSMASALRDHNGVCSAYSGLFYLLGISNGLSVTIDHDHINHDCNYVLVNGEWLSMDVMYDDMTNSYDYYLKHTCARYKEHTQPAP